MLIRNLEHKYANLLLQSPEPANVTQQDDFSNNDTWDDDGSRLSTSTSEDGHPSDDDYTTPRQVKT